EIANGDRGHIKHNAVEVEVDLLSQLNVDSVVTEEGGLHPYGIAALPQQLLQNPISLLPVGFTRNVQPLKQSPRTGARQNNIWIVRVVKRSTHHLFPLGQHDTSLNLPFQYTNKS